MNAIEDMRERLIKRAKGGMKPSDSYRITQFRPTAFDAPRLPQPNIPSPRPRHDRVGRPSGEYGTYKKRDIFGGWL